MSITYRELRVLFIKAHTALGDPTTRDLPAPATVDDIAASIADLQWELNHPRAPTGQQRHDEGGHREQTVSQSDSMIMSEMSVLRVEILREIRGEITSMVKECMHEALSGFLPRLVEAEERIAALQHESEAQRDEVRFLKKQVQTLETKLDEQAEKAEIRHRATNVIIEGLPAGESRQWPEERVLDFFSEVLQCADDIGKPVQIQRIRTATPTAGGQTMKNRLLVRLASPSDKATVLRSCKKLKDHPHIRVWEDLTPRQQERRRKQVLSMRKLRQAGKKAWIRGDRLFVVEKEGDVPKVVPFLHVAEAPQAN